MDGEELLRVLDRIANALEQIAENTKSDEIKEREYRVKGFGLGENT